MQELNSLDQSEEHCAVLVVRYADRSVKRFSFDDVDSLNILRDYLVYHSPENWLELQAFEFGAPCYRNHRASNAA